MGTNILPETIMFLKDLQQNNNKPWFEANKARYKQAKENVIHFSADLVGEIKKIDVIVEKDAKKYVGRIYRDVRFSKDKSPYYTYFSTLIERGSDGRKCPFYFHIEPNNFFAGGGIWQPVTELLKNVRQEIDYNSSGFHRITGNTGFKDLFGELDGEKLVRPPKGYEPNNPNIELLKLKQYIVHRKFDQALVVSDNFDKEIILTYKAALEFFNFFDVAKELAMYLKHDKRIDLFNWHLL